MALNELWFILVATLFCGYFFFEGFDFGTGMLIPFLSRNDTEKRLLINTIGPVWDANEVWLLTAGGAIFAAFPMWYATMFSGFYLALFLLIAALIARGVAFELRSKGKSSRWKKGWDICISVGSLLAPLLVAVALANLVAGVPIGADGEYAGGFFNLLTVPTIIAGLTAVAVFLYHGSVYLSLKLEGELLERTFMFAGKTGITAVIVAVIAVITAFLTLQLATKPLAAILAILAVLLLAASVIMIRKKKSGIAMLLNGIVIVFGTAALFSALFPNVMVSSLDSAYNLTVYNASSSPYTLKVMTIVACTVLPIVLAYTAWVYWVFRKRIQSKDLEY